MSVFIYFLFQINFLLLNLQGLFFDYNFLTLIFLLTENLLMISAGNQLGCYLEFALYIYKYFSALFADKESLCW